ncbi:IQ domain-containing protein [Actinidia chinensis var. chinensis]|uniref:IQ domain-containing protein n=1 Tax=Actinidia chinensis var. chinensis TaxID=1590841 RepID=A0A2R6QAN4_ACTCC|nr:IQ domain-containing protein [Actinidia chinensis var. chinensis]
MESENQAFSSSDVQESKHTDAALKLQKVYRSYRTRRRLADSAVVAEELWWQAINYARLNHSTVSFFNFSKPETAVSRWSRISLNASKVGKGLCEDNNARKLAFQHWIEAIDPRHRYGHNLNVYYEEWCKEDSRQPFFYWLDIGDGKEVDLKKCPRSRLQQQCIIYLGPQEREHYEYLIAGGTLVHKQTGDLLDTSRDVNDSKWIFVMSTSKRLYAGKKRRGLFHHSSFLAGGATLAAGQLMAECGKLKSISAYSGHYHPTDENLNNFLAFLKENGINLQGVQVIAHAKDHKSYDIGKSTQEGSHFQHSTEVEPLVLQASCETEQKETPEPAKPAQPERRGSYKRSFSSNIHSPKATVPKREILQRIESKKEVCSYQLGHQLSLKWSTGAGPRIGCVADYPQKLRVHALEFVDLSHRDTIPTSQPNGLTKFTSLCKVM